MVAQTSQTSSVTPEQYLEWERKEEYKNEYLNGRIYAMSGASPTHAAITANVTIELGSQLKRTPCQAYSSDLKICANPNGAFFYPDLSVVCGELQFYDAHQDVALNPIVIVEILSPSTEAFDRGKKFAQYQQIETLTDYLLIAQDEPLIDHYMRLPDGRWLRSSIRDLTASLRLDSIDCTLALAEVYDRVTFPATPTTSEPA